jgi:hypothetical protein
MSTIFLSVNVIGAKVFLIYKYGWTRVQLEHLRILDMHNGRPWPVSNGDVIYGDGQFLHFLISVACWAGLFLTTYPLLRLLLPKAR